MGIERVFLGWRHPGLLAVADFLQGRFEAAGTLDLSGVIVVVPGARAGRRLVEILVLRAEERGLWLRPPEIVTLGGLPERLYEAKRPLAGELTQHLAWVHALHQCDSATLSAFLPSPPPADDLAGWLDVAEMLGRLHRELAADGLDFGDVAERGAAVTAFRESARWDALARVQHQYLALLDDLGLWDIQTARRVAVRQREYHTQRQIVLAGTVDLNRVQRQMLDQVAERVTVLILAPEELAGRFDEHGCLRPEAWEAAEIALREEQIELADDPPDQAAAAVRALAGLGGHYRAEDITLGVPDEHVAPFLALYLGRQGVATRNAAGTPIAQTPAFRLLAGVADYLENRQFAALAALVRHPDMEAHLLRCQVQPDYLKALDEYCSNHLPAAVGSEDFEPAPEEKTLMTMQRAVERLLSGLAGPCRPLVDWGQLILDLLARLLGQRPLDPAAEPDRKRLAACEALRETVLGWRAIPPWLVPQVSGVQALRLLLHQVQAEAVPPPTLPHAIELLGWLELPLDDAPVLIATGMNEGIVPSAIRGDLFLPNQLRAALGLDDNRRRYARDAYALSLLAASRQHLHLILGRRDAEGNPLFPSRLLLACKPEILAARTLRLFSPGAGGRQPVPLPAQAPKPSEVAAPAVIASQGLWQPPRPQKLAEPVTSMRVTEFRDYLACPYRYYLRHRLRLAALGDGAGELDGGQFGSLAHAVLAAFGQSEAASATDAAIVLAFLEKALQDLSALEFGGDPRPVVRVQLEQLRSRLHAFAHWQAQWAAQGWCIKQVEADVGNCKAPFVVDGQPMYLHGRIDRIDVHRDTGEHIVFDYKTGDKAKKPEEAHRSGRKADKQWVDLQLPLYRHLLPALGVAGEVRLGYILLPKDPASTGEALAEWTPEELQSADEAAAEVVRKVRREEFWPPQPGPVEGFEELGVICGEGQLAPQVQHEEE